MTKTCIVIAGPTAVGKTDVAIRVANHFHTEIISADSRQCYAEMNIGVARPDEIQLNSVPHHFIASHSIHDAVSAADFEKFALYKLDEIFQKKDVAVVTGGTGLYIKALCEGLDAIPEVSAELRNRIIVDYEKGGLLWLTDMLQKHDHLFVEKGEMKNPQRMMRALEVVLSTGKSIVEFQKSEKATRNFKIIKIGLELPRPVLQERIDKRVDLMMASGLWEEASGLLPYRALNALQTVGYSELFDVVDGKCAMEKAVELIKTHTRQYAKRQMTWFKKDPDFLWFDPSDPDTVNQICARV
jgi:tRNA dimethylallyltransferase